MSKERLVELILQTETYSPDQEEYARKWAEYKAIYLLKNGVVVPTVNPGDKVWCLSSGEVCEAIVVKVEYNFYTTPNEWITVRVYSSYYGAYEDRSRIDLMVGKTVLLTREEAEAKLKNEQ